MLLLTNDKHETKYANLRTTYQDDPAVAILTSTETAYSSHNVDHSVNYSFYKSNRCEIYEVRQVNAVHHRFKYATDSKPSNIAYACMQMQVQVCLETPNQLLNRQR